MAFPSLPARPQLFYGWYIVGASTLNGAVLLGMVFFGFGVFITPLTGRPGLGDLRGGVGIHVPAH